MNESWTYHKEWDEEFCLFGVFDAFTLSESGECEEKQYQNVILWVLKQEISRQSRDGGKLVGRAHSTKGSAMCYRNCLTEL